MKRLYSISVLWLRPRSLLLDQAIGKVSEDWIRFNPSQWFVWSGRPKKELVQAVRSQLLSDEQCVVVVLQPEAADGSAPPWVWNWLNDKMSRQLIGE